MNRQEMFDLFDLNGKVALVSGGTGAIGFEGAQTLAAAGAKIMLTGRNEKRLAELSEKIVHDDGQAAYVAGDPAIYADVEKIVKATVEKYGGIDILVAAHGTSKPGLIHEQSNEEWQEIIDANLNGVYYFCKEAIKVMIPQNRGGKIIIIGSVRGELGFPRYTAYCPSKGAVHLLGKSLAWEVGPQKINVNVIAPGVTRSPITSWIYKDPEGPAYQGIAARMPIGRLGEPEDFQGCTLFLASKASDWVNGHVLCVDGGYTSG